MSCILLCRYAAALSLGILSSSAMAADQPWQVGGRLQVDAARFDADQTLAPDEVALRRARFNVNGKPWDGWAFKLQYELSDGDLSPKSLWFKRSWSDQLALTAGHLKVPFSLQQSTSSKHNTFMERAMPDIFSPGFHLGVGLSAAGDYWNASVGVFGGKLGVGHNVEHDGEAIAARYVLSPVQTDHSVLHLGVSIEQRRYPDGYRLRLRERPETGVFDIRFADTGKISDVDASTRYAVEWAWIQDRFWVQAEYLGANIDRTGSPELGFDGWYAQAGWFLTGEMRRYQEGAFRSVKPLRRSGAVEFAIRISTLDLNDQEIAGGQHENVALALNWYLRKRVRLALNHIWVDAEPRTDALAESARILQLRFQLYH